MEGEIDKEYFELLRDRAHGENRLAFEGDIFAYGGAPVLRNQPLLRFIKDKFSRIFITFDLDSETIVAVTLRALSFEKGKSYLSLGLDKAGQRCVEGLLPNSIRTDVYDKHPDLVDALSGSQDERKQAKSKIKRLLLDQFKAVATPGSEYYNPFYSVAKVINRALRRQQQV